MSEPDDHLVNLAGSVSDGSAVDWESEVHAELGRDLEGLKILSRVARAFGTTHEPTAGATDVLFRWGPLEVREKLGEGRFGEVFRAWDPQVGREVALKLNRSEGTLARSWLAEARRLASVRHPNVVTVFGAAVHDQRAGMWTDLLRGKTLEHRLEHDGPMGAGELAALGSELCRALAAVHGAGLVHGDVKTSNVVRDEDGRWVLVDFGAARCITEDDVLLQGTPAYLAPEVAAGEGSTAASDLYALGALLFRMATGQLGSVSQRPALRDPRPDLPTGLVRTIDALLAEDPRHRPASAGQAEQRLLAARSEPQPAAATARYSRWILATVALLVLAVTGIWRGWRDVPVGDAELPFRASLWGERAGSEIRLGEGSEIRPGDRLALRVEVKEQTHVYVFNEDAAGHLFVLFPLPGLKPANPLSPGGHRLPGVLGGEDQSWEVTSAGGSEKFLIVGSRDSVPRLEQLQEEHERARHGRQIEYSTASEAPGETLRGVGGLDASSVPRPSLLGRVHADLLRDSALPVWAELLVLDNPP